MNLLAFESSTKLGSVALIQDGVCTFKKQSFVQRSHSEILHQFVFQILQESKIRLEEIDVFAAGCGPGSFTGIRVSINTAKAFAYAFNKPLISVDSLENLAFSNRAAGSEILCLINAYKNMSYFGHFSIEKNQTKVLNGPSVIQMKEIERLFPRPTIVAGDGFATYEQFLPEKIKKLMLRPPNLIDEPDAESLGLIAFQKAKLNLTLDWNSIQPLYIRSSEAEENKRGIVWSPLDFKE